LPAKECSFVLGNPPFVGKSFQTAEQKSDMLNVYNNLSGFGVLDYVTCWYVLSANYISNSNSECAFVSTNSITQGEQVPPLWQYLFGKGIKINFAHRTFGWQSDARGAAHVHVVIIGFSCMNR